MAQIRVLWDDAAIKLDTATPGGPVDRAMSRVADEAMATMKRLCPVYTGPPRIPTRRAPVPRRPGTLRNSIRKFRQPDGSYIIGPTDMVGGQLLGPLIEGGTPPHGIDSRGPWSLASATLPRKYFGRHVDHPGTRPHPFIVHAAESVSGITITISER